MLDKFIAKAKARAGRIDQARQEYTSWLDISNSTGWKVYEAEVEKRIGYIKSQIENDMSLNGEDLKRLQLALSVWNEVKRIPKDLAFKAKGR